MSAMTPTAKAIRSTIGGLIERVAAFRAKATGTSDAKITIRRHTATQDDEAAYARVRGFGVETNEWVLALPSGGEPVILGAIDTAAPTAYKLDAPLTATSINTPVFVRKSQTGADTSSTTNTSTFVDALAMPITLPPGVWTVRINGGVNLAHSAGQSVDRQAALGTESGGVSGATMLTTREHYPIDAVFLSVYGGEPFTIHLQYKGSSGTSGTSSARGPYVTIIAERTS